MLTGELRNQIDRIWNAFWSGGISNPLEVIEQITLMNDPIRSHWQSVRITI
jgi:type I restriction enzyme M protein